MLFGTMSLDSPRSPPCRRGPACASAALSDAEGSRFTFTGRGGGRALNGWVCPLSPPSPAPPLSSTSSSASTERAVISFIRPLGPIHTGTARCVRSSLEIEDEIMSLRKLSSLSSSTSSSAAATAAACAAASRAKDAAACAACAASMGAVMGAALRAGSAVMGAMFGRLGDAGAGAGAGAAADGTSSSETSVSERL